MDLIKKVIKYLLLGVLGIIIYIIISLIISDKFIGFKESKEFPKIGLLFPFKDSVASKLWIESFYKNYFNDSIYVLNYKNNFHIYLLIIESFKNHDMSDFIELNNQKLTRSNFKCQRRQTCSRSNPECRLSHFIIQFCPCGNRQKFPGCPENGI